MKVYKLTTQDGKTYNNTQWGEGVTHKTSGEGDLCGPGWLHYYHSPELAALLNPIHAGIGNPVLWLCKTGRKHKDDRGLKGGTTKLTTIRQIPLPVFTPAQRVAFAIYCALEFSPSAAFKQWAEAWLSGANRSAAAARAAASAAAWAAASASAAAWAAAEAAAEAAAAWAAQAAAAAAAPPTKSTKADFSFLQQAAEKALKIS